MSSTFGLSHLKSFEATHPHKTKQPIISDDSVSKKACRGGALTRPRILRKQNPSPQGEKYSYFPSENPKNAVFRRAGPCPAPTGYLRKRFFDSLSPGPIGPGLRFLCLAAGGADGVQDGLPGGFGLGLGGGLHALQGVAQPQLPVLVHAQHMVGQHIQGLDIGKARDEGA